jgi:hypothetical protein
MASPFDPTDPAHLTPAQRHDEIAALLATGVRRLFDLRTSSPVSLLPDSAPNCLDVPLDLSVHGSCPVNATREQKRS